MGSIGIDLGTTYSCVGIWRNNGLEMIPNELGNTITPSLLAFTDNQPLPLVGDAAHAQLMSDATNTIFDAKRLIGRRFSEVQSDMKSWPFEVISWGADDKPMICVTHKGEKKQFTAEEMCCMLLKKLKQNAELHIGGEVKSAVITVPLFFNHSQRQAIAKAAETAGINVLRIMDEPVAAAIAFGFHNSLSFAKESGFRNFVTCFNKKKKKKRERDVLIFDLGGATFNLAVVGFRSGGFEVKATAWDAHLGGSDFDQRMMSHLIEEFKRKHKDMNINIVEDPKAVRRLLSACEKAKRILSTAPETIIDIDCLFEGMDFSESISRDKFEELNADLFIKCMDLADKCLRDAGVNAVGVDDVVLVGGSSRIPKLQKLLCKLLNHKELRTPCAIDPDQVVAYGASVKAAGINGEMKDLVDLMPIKSTPLSLGIELHSRKMHVVIPKNTRVPARNRVSIYSPKTSSEFRIRVFQGERARATDNQLLGEFVLRGIEMGTERDTVDVVFGLQSSGILTVSARDRNTGRRGMISMEIGASLSRRQVKMMRKGACDCALNFEDFKYKMRVYERTDYILFWNTMRQYMRNRFMEMSWAHEYDVVEDEINRALEWSVADLYDEPAKWSEYNNRTQQLMRFFFPSASLRMAFWNEIREKMHNLPQEAFYF